MHSDGRERLYEQMLRKSAAERTAFDYEASVASINLALTCDVHEGFLFKRLGPYGLAKSSFNLLALLRFAHPDGLQLSQIGDLLITSRANVTGLIDHLEQRGFVRRVVNSHDRRARLAKLTKKGELVVDAVMPGHRKRTSAFFTSLTLEEVQQLAGLLKKLRRSAVLEDAQAGEMQCEDAALLDPIFASED